MKKHLLSIIASIVICAALLIGCGGGGGGGGGSSTPSEPSEFIYSTEVNSKGTFRLTSSKSGAIVESSENGTLATGSSIVLTERLAKSNESKLYGGNSSNIYTLQAKNDDKKVTKLEKPVMLTIPNKFSKEFKKFFLGSRSETASDWQYTQILDDNDTNPTVVKSARLAVKDLSTFKIKTYRLSCSFAIFASKDDSSEDKPANSDSVKSMHFSAMPTTIYYDKNSKYITDIKVSSCITANKSSALFDGSEVTSQLVFFNGNSADLSGIKIDGSTANQFSSTTKDSSTNQYSHILYIKSYKKNNISISGNNATYTFELKLTGVPINDFPESFRVKTVLKDTNGTEFASEGSIKLKKAKEPQKTDTKTNTNTSTSTLTKTSTNTSTSTGTKTATNTKTSTSTSTGTNTKTSTNTKTDTSSNTQTSTSSDTSSNTNTSTSSDTGSSTDSTTSTETSTNTESNTSTQTTTESQTNTNTETSSNTASDTSTNTENQTSTEISVSITPTNSETVKVEVTTPIKITFNEKMDKTQNLLTLVTLICNSTTTNLITASNQLEWSTENDKDVLTVKNIKLAPEQSYTIKLNSGLKTESGLTSSNQITSNFVTRDSVILNVTNLVAQNTPLNTRIEVTPTNGTVSNIENASIRFDSTGKAGSFSLENGKVYYTLTSGTTWDPATYYSGSISGILDSDSCETKSCNFTFTTRPQTTLTFQTQNAYHARSNLLFTVNNGNITDLSTANIDYSDCSLSFDNGNILCSLKENAQWNFNSYHSVTISNLKDSEGAPVANSTANFNIGAQPYLSRDLPIDINIKANSDLVFNVNESTITNLNNANITITGANVSGNLQLVNGKVVYKLTNNSLYPFYGYIEVNISGLKDSNGVTVQDFYCGFRVDFQKEISFLRYGNNSTYGNLREDIVLYVTNDGDTTGWDISNATAVFDNANVSGYFAFENGNIVYKLNNGYNYPPETRVTGKISGIKDADGLPVQGCDISFETRKGIVLSSWNEEISSSDYGYPINEILFYLPFVTTEDQNTIGNLDLSNVRIVFDNGTTVNGSFNLQINYSDSVIHFTPDNPFPFDSIISGKLTGVKDFEGVTIPDCNFNYKTRKQSSISQHFLYNNDDGWSNRTTAYLNDKLLFEITDRNNIFLISDLTNTNLTNAIMTFDNCNINGSLSISDNGSSIIFTPNSNQLWPPNTTVTGKISGITDFDGGIISEYSFSFKTHYLAGKGTQNEPWLISSADDLYNIRFLNQNGIAQYYYYLQTQDIDLTTYGTSYDNGKGWLPIEYMYGYYDGNNKKITNLYINRPNESVGLFNSINGSINNLGIEISASGIKGLSGAVLANSSNFEELKNCWVSGSGKITCSDSCSALIKDISSEIIENCYSTIDVEGKNIVGGLFANAICENINNCYSCGNVICNYDLGITGGLIGQASGKIKNSYSTCNVTGGNIIGGLTGNYQGDIEKCYSEGSLTGRHTVGGLIGNCTRAKIYHSYSKASQTIVDISNSGGFVGMIESNCIITSCYALGDVSGDYAGAFVGFIEQGNNSFINCYSKGNVFGLCAGGFVGGSYNTSNVFINCYAGCLKIEDSRGESDYNEEINRFIGYIIDNGLSSNPISITNCYANKNMKLIKNGVTSQPGLQNPLPETVALDGVDGANLPDNPDWKNEIFKDGYENGESFDDVWEIGTSGLPILKNMPGNPVQ